MTLFSVWKDKIKNDLSQNIYYFSRTKEFFNKSKRQEKINCFSF